MPLHHLYESGQYAEAADQGRELIKAHPEYAGPLYNLACCESLAGRTDDAIRHLRLAIDRKESFRSLAAEDSDFDPIRDEAAFKELVQATQASRLPGKRLASAASGDIPNAGPGERPALERARRSRGLSAGAEYVELCDGLDAVALSNDLPLVIFGAFGIAVLKFSSVIHFATTLVDSSACSGVSKRPSELSTPLPASIR